MPFPPAVLLPPAFGAVPRCSKASYEEIAAEFAAVNRRRRVDVILTFSCAVSSGGLEAAAVAAGRDPGLADALIAGTAVTRELTVVTHNIELFAPFALTLLSPEECRPVARSSPSAPPGRSPRRLCGSRV